MSRNRDRPELLDGWEWQAIGDLCSPIEKVKPADAPDIEFQYIDISAVDRKTKTIGDVQRLRGAAAPSRARQRVRTGDVLVSTVRPSLQTVSRVPARLDGAIASSGFCVLRADRALDPKWLFYWVLSPAFRESLAQKARGVSYPAVLDKEVRAERILLPPLNEQRIIAEQIERVENAAREGEAHFLRAEQRCSQLWKSMLDRLSESAQTQTTLGEVAEVFVGATPSRKDASLWGGEIPWVSSGEIAFAGISETRTTITDAGLGNRATRLHPPGTVLLAMIGEGKTRGRAAILEVPAAHNQNSAAIRPDRDRLLPEFLYYWLMRQYETTRRVGAGSQQPALSGKLVRAIEIPLPSIARQREVVAWLGEQERLIESLRGEIEGQLRASALLRRTFVQHTVSGSRPLSEIAA